MIPLRPPGLARRCWCVPQTAQRRQGMIPTRDTAHLVQDPDGNWVVVGTPKPADGTEWLPPPHLDHGQPRTNTFHHPERFLHNQDDDDESD